MEEQKQSLWDRWSAYILKKKKSGRPEGIVEFGEGLDKFTIRLPKTVYEQLELVNLSEVMEKYPNDFTVKSQFINKILPLTTYLEKPVTDINELSFAQVETLIVMYCDLLLSPLSQKAQEETAQTIEKFLEKHS